MRLEDQVQTILNDKKALHFLHILFVNGTFGGCTRKNVDGRVH